MNKKKLDDIQKELHSSKELNQISFSEDSMNKVLKEIQPRPIRKHLLYTALSAVALFVFIFIGINALREPSTQNGSESVQQLPISTSQPSQGDILALMSSTEDKISTAKGSFIVTNSALNTSYEVNFEVSLDSPYGGKEEVLETLTNTVNNNYFTSDASWRVDETSKTFEEFKSPDSNLPYTERVLKPTDIKRNYLSDKNNWEIEGISTVSGRKAYYLKGNVTEYNAERLMVDSFEFWIDEKTGILLKSSYYLKGQLKDELTMNAFQLNETLATSNFTPDLTEYTKRDTP
jgi:outer membrane lipoprotein-sorting protein